MLYFAKQFPTHDSVPLRLRGQFMLIVLTEKAVEISAKFETEPTREDLRFLEDESEVIQAGLAMLGLRVLSSDVSVEAPPMSEPVPQS